MMAMEAERKRLGRRLVIFPSPFQGHLNPMLHLATLLYAKGGFSITIVHTHFNAPDPTNYPNFRFEPIPDGLTDELASTDDLLSLVIALNANTEAPFRDRMARLLSDLISLREEDPIACVIVDAQLYSACYVVGEDIKLPRIVLRTSSAACFAAFTAFPLLREKGYLSVQDPSSEKAIPEIPSLSLRDLPVFQRSSSDDVYHLTTQLVKVAKSSAGVILNTFHALESEELSIFRQELQVPTFPVGPLHKLSPNASSCSLLAQDRSCMDWLDKQQAPRSVIYVSFGSLACMDANELVEIAWGIANSGVPFLWVIRPGSVRGSGHVEELLREFKEATSGRGLVVEWVLQPEVLGHAAVGGFWTHCGWNSVMETISEGVPMLCWPCFGDQMINARFVSHVWKVGIQLERGLERGEIERAVRRLMVEKEGEEISRRIEKLKVDAALCVGEGGSSRESFDHLVDLILSF